uniref:Uncharacterized protein n=1 Tax=Noccaea caerulescens TaxID=107243 RepID=A0A1J3J260_NOCCA
MLSQRLSRISKISPLMQRFRLFSSSLEEFPPHFIYGFRKKGVIDFFFTSDHLHVAEEERKVPRELLDPKGTVGASKGWVFTLQNGLLCLRDDLKINASASNPKRISLPPLEILPHSQTQIDCEQRGHVLFLS